MKDYREVLENLNLIRGTKSASKWIMEITKLECSASSSDYIEYKPYSTLISLKKELICKAGPIPHKFIRSFIKKQIENYDEDYIGKVGQLLSIIEYHCLDDCDDKKCKVLSDIRKCVNV